MRYIAQGASRPARYPGASHPSHSRSPHLKARIDYDLMVNANRLKVARRTVEFFNNIQIKDDKETNVLAIAAAFLLLCRAARVKAQDIFTAATNLMADSLHPDGMDHRFAALLMHLEEDVLPAVSR